MSCYELSICALVFFAYAKIRVSHDEGGARWLSGRASDSEAIGGGSKTTSAVLCPWARHFTPQQYC